MQSPNQAINIEFKEKHYISPRPELSFTSFLDDNGDSLLSSDSRLVAQYENDRRISFDHRYKARINHDEFSKIEARLGIQPGCQRFWNRLTYAKKVYILDKFFSQDNYFRLLYEVEKIMSLFGHTTPIIIKIIAKDFNELRSLGENCAICFAHGNSLNSLEYIHDRFAWIDGEIWHFGASAGGMHASYHAVSGGWEDIDGHFEKFCESFFN